MKAPTEATTGIRQIHYLEVRHHEEESIPSLLLRLKNGDVSREGLKRIVMVRYQAAHFFEIWLELIIFMVKQSSLDPISRKKLQFAAEQNLKEELGQEKEYGGPHKNGRTLMLQALGVDPIKWEEGLGSYSDLGSKMHPAARRLVESLRTLVLRGPIEAISTLWYYENRISLQDKIGDYYILLQALEQKFPEFKKNEYSEGDPLWHISSHAAHDTYHAELAETALEEATAPDKSKKVWGTCMEARKVFLRFWDEVL